MMGKRVTEKKMRITITMMHDDEGKGNGVQNARNEEGNRKNWSH